MPNLQKKQTDFGPFIDAWVYLYLIGLVCSKALLAIAMIGFSLTALIAWISSSTKDKNGLGPFLFPTIILCITVLSGINSVDKAIWLDFVIKKLPFLVLPFSFFAVRARLSLRYYDYLMAFVIIVGVVALGVLGNYLMNFEQLNEAISRGQAITTPIDHTEFSIYVAFTAIVSMFIYLEKKRVVRIGSKSTVLWLALFLVLFLHVLAVRSGLAVFYITGFFMGLYYLIKEKKHKLLLGFTLVTLLLPILAVKTIPSLKKKIGYVNWDLSQYKQGEGLHYSDSERLYSLKAGLAVFQAHPLVGVGIGDLGAACDERYEELLGQPLKHYPHNQYIFSLSSMGLLGFVFYLLALVGPLYVLRKKYDPYFLSLYGVIFISALVENTLERTFSIGFYLFFVLLCISFLTNKWAPQK